MNKTAVITGASRGIGAECVAAFARRGYSVAAIYKSDDESAHALLDNLNELSRRVKLYRCDVSDSGAVAITTEKIFADFGFADVLINNAGIASHGLIQEVSDHEYERVMNTNVKGVFNMTRAFLPGMISNKRGAIINISSIWGVTGASCEAVYSASKAAVIGFTKAAAQELAPSGIRVNCIAPGIIDTDMNSAFSDCEKQALVKDIPVGRFGCAEDIANLAVFLSDDKANYITGQVITADGGFIL